MADSDFFAALRALHEGGVEFAVVLPVLRRVLEEKRRQADRPGGLPH
jgi:hypothetical protein